MYRGLLTGVLSFFLLFMQQESVRHALEHIGAELARSEHSALELPTGDTCVECALLAAGAGAVPAAAVEQPVDACAWLAPAAPATQLATAAPSHYRSRAPPPILQSA
jgi:hypothetical protein